MKIKNIKLQNFKFHHTLEFPINKQNCLIYGENGTGKSSIYWAIYSIFKIYFRDKKFDFNRFKNLDNDNLNVEITIEAETLKIPNENYNLPENIDINNYKSIYFINQDLLETITNNHNNFYITIGNILKNDFKNFNIIYKKYQNINENINLYNLTEQKDFNNENNDKLSKFLNQIEKKANDIINNHFEENFKINFEFESGESDSENEFKFSSPKITLKIDNKSDLKLNFNEAKLKLTSVAIFFALIKLEEDKTNPLKLLVLDDFLTSLDMANRHYIIEYILNEFEFEKYQKIILTHNLQFYNLIKKILKSRKKENNDEVLTDWDIKNIYLKDENRAEIYDKEENYSNRAKRELLKGEFHISGNFLRKEFEQIINEFKQLLEIGKIEQLNNILEILKSNTNENRFYKKPFNLLNKLNNRYLNIENIIKNSENPNAKIGKIRFEINQIKEILRINECELSNLKNLLTKTEFYKNILFNPASHSNEEIEIYRKECINSLKLLEELNKILVNLKG